MTEDQARSKWCPFSVSTDTQGNRIPHPTDGSLPAHGCYCIASDCMCWVWVREETGTHVASGECGLTGKVRRV